MKPLFIQFIFDHLLINIILISYKSGLYTLRWRLQASRNEGCNPQAENATFHSPTIETTSVLTISKNYIADLLSRSTREHLRNAFNETFFSIVRLSSKKYFLGSFQQLKEKIGRYWKKCYFYKKLDKAKYVVTPWYRAL